MENSLAPGVQSAGDVEFKVLELVDTKNKNLRYNLLGAFVDFTVYEDLFSPILTGYVALVESQNLIESIPIVGEELIYAEFATPSLKTIKCFFQITKVGIREHGDKSNNYTLDLIAYEGYIDISQRVSKSFFGNTHDIITKFYKDTFNRDLVDADLSDNSIKFVSPYWSPFKIINHVTSRALLPNNTLVTPNYLFYQTCEGHKFKSITNLINQPSFTSFVFDKNPSRAVLPDGTSTRDINREFAEIKDLTFIAAPDFVNNMLSGAYNHNVHSVDLFNKSYKVTNYSFDRDFTKTAHTDKFKLTTFVAPLSSGQHTIRPVCTNLFTNVADRTPEILANRVSLLAQLETWKLGITIHGRTDLSVGMTVNIALNKFKMVDSTDKHSSDTIDNIYSGKYLITAISHRFTMSKHEINMEVIKDASLSEILVK
jgi:hypothetical protein